MGIASPVMIAQKVELKPPAGGAEPMNAEPMKAQDAAAAIASREASPMAMAHGSPNLVFNNQGSNHSNMAAPMAQPVDMGQSVDAFVGEIAKNWQECANCDVTHEVVSEGVYR